MIAEGSDIQGGRTTRRSILDVLSPKHRTRTLEYKENLAIR
jgi:hypothetical protein